MNTTTPHPPRTTRAILREHMVMTAEGELPAHVYAAATVDELIAAGWKAANRASLNRALEAGEFVAVRSHGRVRSAIVLKVTPTRARLALTTPGAVDEAIRLAGRESRTLEQRAAMHEQQAREGQSKPHADWHRYQAQGLRADDVNLTRRGVTGHDATVASFITITHPNVSHCQIAVRS